MITTLDILKASWPLVLSLVSLTVWLASLSFSAKRTEKDFREFRTLEYTADMSELSRAIKEVQASQERSEEKLERKLDLMSSRSDSQLQKVYDELNKTTILLAELKGRLYSKSNINSDNS